MKVHTLNPLFGAFVALCLMFTCTIAEAFTGYAITDDVDVDTRSYNVTFDLGTGSTRTGGGQLSQSVLHGAEGRVEQRQHGSQTGRGGGRVAEGVDLRGPQQ